MRLDYVDEAGGNKVTTPLGQEKAGLRLDFLDGASSGTSSIMEVKKTEGQLREETKLHGWEKSWDQIDQAVRHALPMLDSENPLARSIFHNPAMPVAGALQTFAGTSRELVSQGMVLPFAKFLLPSEREIFDQLNDDDKARSLAWEGFGAALWAIAPAFKMAKGPAKKLAQWNTARKMFKMTPIEDAVAAVQKQGGVWAGFDHKAAVEKAVKGMGFAKDEVTSVAQVVTGTDSVVLKALEYEKGLASKELSKGWKRFVQRAKPGELYGKPSLSKEATEQLSYVNLQAKHFSALYKTNMQTIGKEAKLYYAENIMKEQVSRFYGAEAAEAVSFASMSEVEMANVLSSMLSPRGKKLVGSVHKLAMGEYRLPWVHPERDVYGMGEAVFGTKTKVFDKLGAAFGNANKYTVEKMSTFMQMLEDRGFGKMVKGKHGMDFVPDKELWTKKNLGDAYNLLKKIDNLAEAGRKGQVIKKADANVLIQDMMTSAKADTPVVAEVVSLVRDYHDVLYKDLLLGYLPKTVRRAGLTAKGEAVVSNLERVWLPKVEQAFKSNSGVTSAERVKLVKDMLRDFRGTLKKEPGAFNATGKKLEETIEGLFGRLAYGSAKPGGIPAYLDHYMPRVGMKGASFEAKWKQALTGEASFMKHRQLAQSQELVPTLQEMLEARTRAQAKQMFFYDEVSDVVDFARTLPESWQKHTDFTISRLLGKPSAWDEKLATVLQKVAPGNWDSYRAMRAAQKITGLQYTGLIGLRPFAVFRNLTQPIIMTSSELGGGVRDHYSMLKGLALSATKKHREYIRSIGAITDFVPDFQRGPILPKTGVAAKWDSTRDAFMWMFRKSDEMNRYWSGGAAVDKWEHTAALVQNGVKNVSAFSRKLGLGGQEPWLRNEVEGLLHLGRFDEAKASYVRNIVANTQYLYTVLDAPAATGLGGAQKMVTSFHSWWMNYGSALSRWVSTGTGTDKVKRMGSFLVSSLAAEQLLEAWAGRGTALRSTFFGPLPLGTAGMPPALEPLAQALKTVAIATQPDVIGDVSKRELAVRTAMSSLKSAGTTFVPGGLLGSQMIKGWNEDEWPGLASSIVQYRKDEEFEPLFGAVE